MIFMVPNMTTKSADTNHTNGADWLADEPNLAPERWGRGVKSHHSILVLKAGESLI